MILECYLLSINYKVRARTREYLVSAGITNVLLLRNTAEYPPHVSMCHKTFNSCPKTPVHFFSLVADGSTVQLISPVPTSTIVGLSNFQKSYFQSKHRKCLLFYLFSNVTLSLNRFSVDIMMSASEVGCSFQS